MEDRVIVMTGASSGIGYAAALKFAEMGSSVVAIGRNEVELGLLREASVGFDGVIIEHRADLRDEAEVDSIYEFVSDSFGRIDVLVNSAGIIASGTIADTSLENWDNMMDINLRTVFYMMHKCTPHLVKTRGNVVNVSSVAGPRAFPNVLAYCVSKAGVDQLTRCAALELAPKGVRVNAVNPGVVVTNLHKRSGMTDDEYQDFLKHSEETHPLGRAGEAEEVADLIYFLASEKAAWITGATYEIDGGRAQTCAR